MNSSLYKYYRVRIRGLVSTVIILNIILLFRIFSIQVLENKHWESVLIEETVKIVEKVGDRGIVKDRNKNSIVQNANLFTFWINTTAPFDEEKIIHLFSKTFNKNKEYYRDLLKEKSPYLIIERDIEKIHCKNIITLVGQIEGLRYDFSNKRFYPYNNIASNIIGFYGGDKNNSSGVEYYFDEILSGDIAKSECLILDNGTLDCEDVLVQPGKDLELTIDVNFQLILDTELKRGVERSEAKSANGIIVNPHTGEILAMASIPNFSPNKYSEYSNINYKNKVISDNYEPGSTFKIIALAAALENSSINLEDSIFCENGEYPLSNKHVFHDHEPHGMLSVPEIFAFSSNIGMLKIADLISNKDFYNKIRDFGFGVKTGLLLPDEQGGHLRHYNNWSYQSNKSISVGQEISCTNLQLAMAYSAIANGGYLLQPYIIKSIDEHNNLKSNVTVVRKVLSESTSNKMLNLLKGVVDYGSGTNAKIDGYNIIGKTGTAQKAINGEYSSTDYVSSFASIFPFESPQYVCIVSVDSPNKSKGRHWANETAAPIIKEIYKKIINIKNIKPETLIVDRNKNINKDDYIIEDMSLNEVPNFRGKTLKQSIQIGKRLGLTIEPVGLLGRVVWQSANPGANINDIDICQLKIEQR